MNHNKRNYKFFKVQSGLCTKIKQFKCKFARRYVNLTSNLKKHERENILIPLYT